MSKNYKVKVVLLLSLALVGSAAIFIPYINAQSAKLGFGKYKKDIDSNMDLSLIKDPSIGSNLIANSDFPLESLQPGQKIPRIKGSYKVAQFKKAPLNLSEIDAWVPTASQIQDEVNDTEYYYESVSLLKYHDDLNNAIYVTTMRMSPALAKIPTDDRFNLKKKKIKDGTPLQATVPCDANLDPISEVSSIVAEGQPVVCATENSEAPYQISFEKNDYLVTLASNLPIEQISNLVDDVVLK